MAEEAHGAIKDFSQLPAADRSAIERLLSSAERRALRRALHAPAPTPTRSSPRQASRPDLSGHSPWLSKRILQILDAKSGAKVTARSRTALQDIVINRARQS